MYPPPHFVYPPVRTNTGTGIIQPVGEGVGKIIYDKDVEILSTKFRTVCITDFVLQVNYPFLRNDVDLRREKNHNLVYKRKKYTYFATSDLCVQFIVSMLREKP